MVLDVVDGIPDIRMRVVAFRQQHGGAEIDWLSPPLAENGALKFDPLDHRGIRRYLNRRNDFVDHEANGGGRFRIECDAHRIAKEVSWRFLPVLAFPLIVVKPNRVSV